MVVYICCKAETLTKSSTAVQHTFHVLDEVKRRTMPTLLYIVYSILDIIVQYANMKRKPEVRWG